MIPGFDEFATPLSEVAPISELDGAVIAIEASHYLNRLLVNPNLKEPLLAALGGLPFTMRNTVSNDMAAFRTAGITPVFIFDGIDVSKTRALFQQADEAVRANSTAWNLYNQHHAVDAVAAFGESCAVTPETFYRYFQLLLKELGVDFQVAPYSALAQLAYLEQHGSEFVDAVCGSSEILLFDVDKVITKLDLQQGEFTWLKKRACLESLGNIPSEVFVDACMLSGSAFLPTLPQLDASNLRKPTKIKAALDLMNNFGRSGIAVCLHYQDDPQIRQMDYLDRYRRSRLAVKHHVILTKDGKLELFDQVSAPGDSHEFIGQRLPDEVYYYLSKGLVGPRVLNWRTTGEIAQGPPLDNGESSDYQRFVRNQIIPLRVAALSVLSHHLHRVYLHKDVMLRVWFDRNNTTPLIMGEAADPKPVFLHWNVGSAAFTNKVNELKDHGISGVLGVAVASLADQTFAKQTIIKKDESNPLRSKDEVAFNTLWRFLHLRGYIDSDHFLTPWGQVLQRGLEAAGSDTEIQEAVFIAIELLRLELLHYHYMFTGYSHAPSRGSDDDRKYNTLISRVASLGRLGHKAIGFTGPLSRHLLGYHSMITTMRKALRDLEEMCLLTLFLRGDAERERDNFAELSFTLPFLTDNDVGMGIAVKSYLDELASHENPTSPSTRDAVRKKGSEEWFPHCIDYAADLDRAFKIWDAVYAAVKDSGDLVKEKKFWRNTDEWLAQRR
ncbi:MAG: hypothetical protein M1821_000376 [Bathelium mastoideum]|nr:MAG: hypothetical protein M1821_000376 [Bathelium mastoideum]